MSLLLCRNDERKEVKHLIAFLGYNLSRIQHPVYRQFVQVPFARRNATLLFRPRPLEEREIVHEVNELRRREGHPCELTFHLCATLDNPAMGQQIVQTVTMIHRLYECPVNIYCLIPDLEKCTEEEKKTAWKCLVSINNAATDYSNLNLMSHCFLYHDDTQVSLANFLFSITQHPEAYEEVSRYGFIGKVITRRRSDPTQVNVEFPSIFSSFNAHGIVYPEDEVRYYIHQSYLHALLGYSRPALNPVSMERCNEHIDDIMSVLPLDDDKIALTADTFIDLGIEKHRPWQEVESYWKSCTESVLHNLEDMPREEWMYQLRNGMDVYYKTRFRESGVEFFYSKEKRNTSSYCDVILASLRQQLKQVLIGNPYPPETHMDMVRSIVNRLQQKAVMFTQQLADLKAVVKKMESEFEVMRTQWDAIGFFDRMRGKDKLLFEEFKEKIMQFNIVRTRLAGADFATKFLNELIPQVSALSEGYDRLGQICQELYDASGRFLEDNPPSDMEPEFPSMPVIDAAQAIRVDQEQLKADYSRFTKLLYSDNGILDCEVLMQQLREIMSEDVDRYIHQRIDSGTMSPVLDINIVDRLSALYADRNGITGYLQELKKKTALSLRIKGDGGRNEQYLLIAPDAEGVGHHVESIRPTSLYMLHIISGISLGDLDGFAGQRMFVEPSIF